MALGCSLRNGGGAASRRKLGANARVPTKQQQILRKLRADEVFERQINNTSPGNQRLANQTHSTPREGCNEKTPGLMSVYHRDAPARLNVPTNLWSMDPERSARPWPVTNDPDDNSAWIIGFAWPGTRAKTRCKRARLSLVNEVCLGPTPPTPPKAAALRSSSSAKEISSLNEDGQRLAIAFSRDVSRRAASNKPKSFRG
jgi:hypothetical protein